MQRRAEGILTSMQEGLGSIFRTGRKKEKVDLGDTIYIRNQSRAGGPTSESYDGRKQLMARDCQGEPHISNV